ncbi:DNA-processing protein DprA [Thiolapillus brandeum]|uniref:DNA processing protein n=1 Tax=Thiolapillus brandeum TaxID=1076588 RepID=A0A7U6GGV3_9GAMM|nr:DNA-processing protein DprA [Thiolapillus brandeum]BAO43350.1 DNA processing protein [Thiolapillus brandeum]
MQEELLAWLALMRLPGIGPAKLNPLLRKGFSVEELLRHPPSQVGENIREALRHPDWEQAEKDLRWLEQERHHFLPLTSPHYPPCLSTLPDAPTGLFINGRLDLLSSPQIAMVGSRNPTRGGAQTAEDFARHFAASGLSVTSGLAMGIDTASHRGALAAGGSTIAVMATGLDRVYPASNRDLAHEIAAHGALVSEFPPGTSPRRGHFPRRNRIISGLSLGVLVVEAALKSGSLITARLAGEQCREVFAIPGSIHNPLARGCHKLIREGAKLVETASDVLEELAPGLRQYLLDPGETDAGESPSREEAPGGQYSELLEAMGHDPVSTDTLVERTGLAPEAVSSMLLLLEMEGRVSSEPGGLFTLAKT